MRACIQLSDDLFACGTLSPCATPRPHSMQQSHLRLRYIDRDLGAAHGARCMDGSAGGLYFTPATSAANRSRLVVFIEGGGECRTLLSCATWAFRAGSSSNWPTTMELPRALPKIWPNSPMDPSPAANPDFHDWAKLSLPYCSGDMHSGTRRDRDKRMGWFFSGHALIVAALAQLGRSWPDLEPTDVLLLGSSAGGIGVLLHADVVAEHWPAARVKASPESGLFYAGVRSLRDFRRGAQTPARHMGLHRDWQPFVHPACARANADAEARCTHAHLLHPHIRTPLYVRENQYDAAKLANCGLDVHSHLGEAEYAYLREWGQTVRRELRSLGAASKRNGAWAPSCLAHAGNLGFASSPRLLHVGGGGGGGAGGGSGGGGSGGGGGAGGGGATEEVRLRDAFRAWFWEAPETAAAPRVAIDDCGELPCTNATASEGQACPHLVARECGALCLRARRERRIRDGKNPDSPGHNVCDVPEGDHAPGDAVTDNTHGEQDMFDGLGQGLRVAPLAAAWCRGPVRPPGAGLPCPAPPGHTHHSLHPRRSPRAPPQAHAEGGRGAQAAPRRPAQGRPRPNRARRPARLIHRERRADRVLPSYPGQYVTLCRLICPTLLTPKKELTTSRKNGLCEGQEEKSVQIPAPYHAKMPCILLRDHASRFAIFFACVSCLAC